MYVSHYGKCGSIRIKYCLCIFLRTRLHLLFCIKDIWFCCEESLKKNLEIGNKKVTKHTENIYEFQPFVRLKQDDMRHRVENGTNVTKEGNIKGLLFGLSLP